MLCSHCLGLVFYRQLLLEKLNVASLSRPTVFLQCYSLVLLYFAQINDVDVGSGKTTFPPCNSVEVYYRKSQRLLYVSTPVVTEGLQEMAVGPILRPKSFVKKITRKQHIDSFDEIKF